VGSFSEAQVDPNFKPLKSPLQTKKKYPQETEKVSSNTQKCLYHKTLKSEHVEYFVPYHAYWLNCIVSRPKIYCAPKN